jgi:tetratricopeptide (TPR) repeat protein
MRSAAERMAEKRSANDPALTVDMLVNLGHIYATREENDNARRTLKRAYELSQALDDPAIRASAACSWAVAVDMDGDQTGALRLIEEGLGFTSPEARFDGAVVSCLVHRATIGLRQYSAQLVSASAQEALRRLDRRPAAYPENRATALQLAAAGHRLAGETAEADRMYARALEQVQRIGREDTLHESAILNNWALNVAQTSPLRAVEMYRRVIELLGGQSADSVPVPPLINYAGQLMRVGRHAEARAILERARDLARRHGQAQRGGVVDMRLAHACRELGDLPCARASLLAAEKGVLAAYPEGHRFRGELAREQALLAEAEGRHHDAHRLLLDADEIHGQIKEKSSTQVETLLALSRIELGLGSTAEAEARARSALAVAEGIQGGMTHSAWVGQSLLALAAARHAQGDAAGAREMRRRAVEHLLPTLGESHPDLVEARRLLGP